MKPETLKKCLSGTASEEEWAAYQQWLDGMPDEEDQTFSIDPEESTADRVWEQIQTKNKQHARSLKYKNSAIGASIAASILMIFYFSIFQGTSAGIHAMQTMVFQHDNDHPFMEKEFEGIRLQLGSNSKVKMQSQKSNDIDIQLTGNMMLSNTSNEDKYTEVLYTESNGDQIYKKVCLKRGKKYLLTYHASKEDRLMVIEGQALMDLPPMLVMNLRNDFNLL